jgi:hypothetical protein
MKIQLNTAVWAVCIAAVMSVIWASRRRSEEVSSLREALHAAESRAESSARRAAELDAESRRLRAHASEIELGRQELLAVEAAQFKQRASAAEAEVRRLLELSKTQQPQATA